MAQHERAQLRGGSAGDASAGLGFRLVSLLLGWFMQQPPSLVGAGAGAGAERVGAVSSPWGTVVGVGVEDVESRKRQLQEEEQRQQEGDKGKGLFRSIYSYFGGGAGEATQQVRMGGWV